jgi:hypothetical protein
MPLHKGVPKETFMSLVVTFTATFEPTILWLLKLTEHFHDIYSAILLWWPFSNALAFLK